MTLVGFFFMLGLVACSPTVTTAGDAGPVPSGDAGPVIEPDAHPVVEVTMNANDPSGSGWNGQETYLNVTNVNPTHFGKLFTRGVDGDQFAQPLFMGNLKMASGTKNVVFVATAHDSVYAFDADDAAAATPLWKVSLGTSAPIPNPWFSWEWLGTDGPCTAYNFRESGISATPVIDPSTNTMYVVALDVDSSQMIAGQTCVDLDSSDKNYCKTYSCSTPTTRYRLHALDLATGAEKFGGPVNIEATAAGTGAGNVDGKLTFDATLSLARTSLVLANGNVYFATASYGDQGNYHGWMFAYDASTLHQVAALCNTPNGGFGGIWQSGRSLLADESGNMYVVAGNGTFSANSGGHDYADTVMRLNAKLEPQDYFAPFLVDYDGTDFPSMWDDDLGSAGATMIPGTSLLLVTGKLGNGYLVDRGNLGHWNNSSDNVVQKIRMTWRYNKKGCNDGVPEAAVYETPVTWVGPNGTHVYVWALGDYLRDYALDGNGTFDFHGLCFCNPWPVINDDKPYEIDVSDPACGTPESQGGYASTLNSGALSVSSNKSEAGSGIVWATHALSGDTLHNVVPGVVEAYDATNVSTPIWSSATNSSRDGLGSWAKFTPPTVANGKVYVPTFSDELVVYGLLP